MRSALRPTIVVALGFLAFDPITASGQVSRPIVVKPSPAVVLPAAIDRNATVRTGGLGTFVADPVLIVRGNSPNGTGFTPFAGYGPFAMDLYGPISAYRAVTAPVKTYVRGFDGVIRPVEGTSFSYPFRPSISPIVYPTQRNRIPGFRSLSTPAWWQTGVNWIDQN